MEILEAKDENSLHLAFQQEENQSSTTSKNVQPKHDQPNRGQNLRNLPEQMRPKKYRYEPFDFNSFSLSSMGDKPRKVKDILSGDGSSHWKCCRLTHN